MKMIAAVFFVLVFLAIRSAAGGSDSLGELSGREDLVKWAGYGEDKLSTVVIAGKIICHAGQTPSVVNPHPVSGARVVVVCGLNRKARKVSSSEGSTDGFGNFAIDLPSHLHSISNLEKVCHVRIVNLPGTSPCRRACAARHIKPTTLSFMGNGIRTYTTPNIHLSPT